MLRAVREQIETIFREDPAAKSVVEGWQRKQIEWLGGKIGVAPIRPGENVPEWKAG